MPLTQIRQDATRPGAAVAAVTTPEETVQKFSDTVKQYLTDTHNPDDAKKL
jgi:hypothetical protein